MHILIPMGLEYNDIIVVAICQLMIFLIDLSKAYLSVVAVITPEAKICGVHPLIFFFFFLFLSKIFLYMVDLTGFGLATSLLSSYPA